MTIEEREGTTARGRPVDAGEVRARQRDEYGGINWGAAFFGWLVAVGMAAILTGILSAAGAAIGLTEISSSDARGSAEEISLIGAIVLVLILALAYYCGGYVSGRMSRFDGGRQGIGVWVVGLLVTILLAVLGAIAGSEYNVFAKLELPRIPVDEGTLTTGGIIALVAVVLLTIIAAMAGGKAGERYHRKVDRVGFAD
jgi:amino acid transporter